MQVWKQFAGVLVYVWARLWLKGTEEKAGNTENWTKRLALEGPVYGWGWGAPQINDRVIFVRHGHGYRGRWMPQICPMA